MNWPRELAKRFRMLAHRTRFDADLEEEMRLHLELRRQEQIKSGMAADDARAAALRKFGNVTSLRERSHSAWGWEWFEHLTQDFRYGLRMLRKSPGFTAVALLSLALGIGANTAIFSLADQTLLRLLPVQDPEQLVVLSSTETKSGRTSSEYDVAASFSYPMYKELRDKNQVFSGAPACVSIDANISGQHHTERGSGELVSGNFFEVLGVRATLGRMLSPTDETAPGANPVAVLSYGYWRDHLGGSAVLDRTLVVNGTPLTIVGVAQPGFTGVQVGSATDVYIPLTMKAEMTPNWNGLDNVSDYFLDVIGRLKLGVSVDQARSGLQPLFHAILESELPLKNAQQMVTSAKEKELFLDGEIQLSPGARGRPVLQKYAQAPVLLLMAIVVLVLMIASRIWPVFCWRRVKLGTGRLLYAFR